MESSKWEVAEEYNQPVEATCGRPQVPDNGQENTGEPMPWKPEVSPDKT